MKKIIPQKPSRPGAGPLAVALGTEGRRRGEVPRVMAAGKGEMARRIIELARENGLAIEKDTDLAQVLVQMDLGDRIPEALFMAVAELLYYVYEVNASMEEGRGPAFK